jgi:hypothetical protein
LSSAPSSAPSRILHNLDSETVFVHRPVVAPAKQHEIVEPRFSAIRPVFDVMCIAEAVPAARKTAPAIPVVEGSANGGRHGPALAAHIEHRPIGGVAHDDTARITSDAPGRSRGNV